MSSLKNAGVDMSHVSISRSYAILAGIEAYVKTRERGRKLVKKLVHERDKVLSVEKVATKAAEREGRLEMTREKMRNKLHIGKGSERGSGEEI